MASSNIISISHFTKKKYEPGKIPNFPHPRLVASHMIYCECTWVHAPAYSGIKEYPFVLKRPSRFCPEHGKDYYES